MTPTTANPESLPWPPQEEIAATLRRSEEWPALAPGSPAAWWGPNVRSASPLEGATVGAASDIDEGERRTRAPPAVPERSRLSAEKTPQTRILAVDPNTPPSRLDETGPTTTSEPAQSRMSMIYLDRPNTRKQDRRFDQYYLHP